MNRHSIHLGNAWEPPAGGGGSAQAWLRRFGRPSGIEPGDRVLLVYGRSAPGIVHVRLTLNDAPLPAIGPDALRWEHEITSLLRDRNELVLMPIGPVTAEPTRRDPHGRAALPEAWGRLSLDIVSD